MASIHSSLSADKSLAEVLEGEFHSRSARNPKYSLRAFSRNLGISPSRVSQILRGKQGLSEEKAAILAGKLGYSSEEKEVFVLLAGRQFNRNKRHRKLAESRLERYREHLRDAVDPQTFQLVCDWHHLAVLELVRLDCFEPDAGWIAKKLGIPKKTAQDAIQRLTSAGLLIQDLARWRVRSEFWTTPYIPSEAVREFHHQMMDRAQQKLETSEFGERDYSEVLFAMNRSQMEHAKKRLREFRRGLMKELEAMPGKDALYALSMQFFRMDQDV